MRTLICGLGSIGRRHLRNLRALGQDDIVLLRSGKSTLPEEELAGLPQEHDLAQALAQWKPEAVIVSNPTSLHLDVAIPAAEAGCHLLIEKPLSDRLDRVDELKSGLAKGGGRALVGFQFRFHPGLRKLRELLISGAIGKPLSARAHWGEYLPGWHPWEDYHDAYSARADLGGGVLLTLCHPFDYLRWLLGEVNGVYAEVKNLGELGIQVEDAAEVFLGFHDGPLASIHLDYLQRPPSHWLEVIATRGTIRWDSQDGVVRWWSLPAGEWQTISPPEGFERNEMFVEEMRHFLGLIAGRMEPICTLEDGVKALQIALAAHQSASERRQVVLGEEASPAPTKKGGRAHEVP